MTILKIAAAMAVLTFSTFAAEAKAPIKTKPKPAIEAGEIVQTDEMSARRRHSYRKFSHRRKGRGGSITLAGVVPELAAKIREIQAACGSIIVSAVRSWGATPNHREGKAVDLKGNPSCIYAHLRGWPGGYSTDYAAVQHVHISYSRKHEWGLRFAHGGGHRHGTRYARRHHGRAHYAAAESPVLSHGSAAP